MARDGDIKEKGVRCSFCKKTQTEVKTLIAGPGVYICDECIAFCRNIIEDEAEQSSQEKKTVLKLLLLSGGEADTPRVLVQAALKNDTNKPEVT